MNVAGAFNSGPTSFFWSLPTKQGEGIHFPDEIKASRGDLQLSMGSRPLYRPDILQIHSVRFGIGEILD
jgi:hypothetical protein